MRVQPAAGPLGANDESEMHDPDVLPHMYDEVEMDRIFEKAVAPAELDCAPCNGCICSRPECSACFPPPLPEFGPPIANAETWVVSSEVAGESERERDRWRPMKALVAEGGGVYSPVWPRQLLLRPVFSSG